MTATLILVLLVDSLSTTLHLIHRYKTYYVRGKAGVASLAHVATISPGPLLPPPLPVPSHASHLPNSVSAVNEAGTGQPRVPVPASASPELHVPGKPVNVRADVGRTRASIDLAWDRPRVAWHGVPCAGTPAVPGECPAPIGGTLTGSDGGAPIDSYKVEWSINPFFVPTEFDAGSVDTPATSYTVRNMTLGER